MYLVDMQVSFSDIHKSMYLHEHQYPDYQRCHCPQWMANKEARDLLGGNHIKERQVYAESFSVTVSDNDDLDVFVAECPSSSVIKYVPGNSYTLTILTKQRSTSYGLTRNELQTAG